MWFLRNGSRTRLVEIFCTCSYINASVKLSHYTAGERGVGGRASRKLLIYAKLTVRHCQVGLLNGSFSIGTIGNLLPDRSSSNCRAFTVCRTYPDPARALQFCPSTSLMQSYTHYYIVRAL